MVSRKRKSPAAKLKSVLSAPAKPDPFDPSALKYALALGSDVVFFDVQGTGFVEVSLSLFEGQALRMFEGDDALKVGARLFTNAAGPQEPIARGELVGEFRSDALPVTLEPTHSKNFGMFVNLPYGGTGSYVLELDLVRENKYWLSDLGHKAVQIPIHPRYAMSRHEDLTPLDLSEAKRLQAERTRREDRYEAIIFSLLNRLKTQE